jgi:two-component system chemotaxis response regulator CheY
MVREKIVADSAQNGAGGSPRKTVLLADDELHVRLFLSRLVASLDMEVVGEASNGAEALALYRQKRPHMLLLDHNMPGMTGMEVLRELIREFPDARIVMLSSVADRRTVELCAELGAAHYIRKDSPFEDMVQVLRDVAFGEGESP